LLHNELGAKALERESDQHVALRKYTEFMSQTEGSRRIA